MPKVRQFVIALFRIIDARCNGYRIMYRNGCPHAFCPIRREWRPVRFA